MIAPIHGGAPASGVRPRVGRVLILDDEPLIVRALSLLLSQDREVDGVTSPTEALRRLRAGERYDIILCDVSMPEMSGIDFHDAVARELPAQAQRIVFVTGGITNDGVRRRVEASSRTVLDKPVEPRQLCAVIGAYVDEGPALAAGQ